MFARLRFTAAASACAALPLFYAKSEAAGQSEPEATRTAELARIRLAVAKFAADAESQTMCVIYETRERCLAGGKERFRFHRTAENAQLGHWTERNDDGSCSLVLSKAPEDLWRLRYKFTNDWFTCHIHLWKTWLAEFAETPCKVLEVGCYEGLATCWLLDHVATHTAATITVVDTFCGVGARGITETTPGVDQSTRGILEQNLATTGASEKVAISQGTSAQFYARSLASEQETYDIIYIDGSHVACDVLHDATCCWALLKPGGILIFDEYVNATL